MAILSNVTCPIKNYKLVKKKIDDMQQAPQKVIKNLTGEAKKRIPGWVAIEVTKQYGVKRAKSPVRKSVA